MSDVTVIATVIGILGTLFAILFGISNYNRNKRIDTSQGGKQDGTVLTEIGYIKSGIDDIKRKQELQDKQYINVITRLTVVESSCTQADQRLNRLENNDA